jgi:hypothetical protein
MANILVDTIIQPGQFNNYLIAGNVCNAFAMGELGASDDFFLVGAEPADESSYPLLTGNILDSEGDLLFRLVRNVLVINPGKCSKIIGDHIGYEIHDSGGKMIFQTQTKFEFIPKLEKESFVTTIGANFYDKNGELVFCANSGDPDEHISSDVKLMMGFFGGFGLVSKVSKEDEELAKIILSTGGSVHQLMTGRIYNQKINLDGKALMDTEIQNCEITVEKGNFVFIGKNNSISHSGFHFKGPAENIRKLVSQIQSGEK